MIPRMQDGVEVGADPLDPHTACASHVRRRLGLVVTGIGLAHFAFPELFDPINQLAFPEHTRFYTFAHGGVETLIGATFLRPHRRVYLLLYAGYLAHLIAGLVRTHAFGAAG